MGVREDKSVLEVAINKIKSLQWIKKDQDLNTQLQDLFTIRQWIKISGKPFLYDFISKNIASRNNKKNIGQTILLQSFLLWLKNG